MNACCLTVGVKKLHLPQSVKVLVAQSCPTLCDPMDCSPPNSSVHGILQARILEGVAIPNPGIKPRSPALQADSFTLKKRLKGILLKTYLKQSHVCRYGFHVIK